MTAESVRRSGDPATAVDMCRDALIRFPEHLSARVTLGWALLDLGKLREAQQEFETVRRKAPDNLAAIRGLAKLHTLHDNETFHEDEVGLLTQVDDFDPLIALPPPPPSLPPAPVKWSTPPVAMTAAPVEMPVPPIQIPAAQIEMPAFVTESIDPEYIVEPAAPAFEPMPVSLRVEAEPDEAELDEDDAVFLWSPVPLMREAEVEDPVLLLEAALQFEPVEPVEPATSPPPVIRRLEGWLARVEAKREDHLTECA